jgi:hypothetical protein
MRELICQVALGLAMIWLGIDIGGMPARVDWVTIGAVIFGAGMASIALVRIVLRLLGMNGFASCVSAFTAAACGVTIWAVYTAKPDDLRTVALIGLVCFSVWAVAATYRSVAESMRHMDDEPDFVTEAAKALKALDAPKEEQ